MQSNTKNILYISYDGMTDPLGQSQVIPYLSELSKNGFNIWLLSFEKKRNYSTNKELISTLLIKSNITWIPKKYTAKPPLFSTIKDVFILIKTANKLHAKENFDIVHCRSYIAAFAGIQLKKKGVKFVFDMRGFWPDERIDGNIWSLKNPVFKMVYNYFKKKEVQYFSQADCTISLTEAGKNEIHKWKTLQNPIPIKVIPCCADFEHFNTRAKNIERLNELKKELDINKEDFILSYLGSIGTWYLLDEMLDFFLELTKAKPIAKFLFISGDSEFFIKQKALEKGIDADKIIVQKASRNDVPAYILLSSLSIFFIKKAYSKIASSPTKMAEIMGMGIPLVCNGGVGDVEQIINETKAGILVKDFTETEYKKVLCELNELVKINPKQIREEATKRFSLKDGANAYADVYRFVIKKEAQKPPL